ncbi:metal ABC transporter substrate-binding protein [uncultured Martelella sp.]|uniref:metal ABC transporter substrate-binding protein n=1 Tax=uncultured Martelella sp. TaxID=392331 RepID=UPI0029C8DB4A|nr:metal ABC transporter substrate-binding protein [uncultured Martelella sp.]
MHLNVILAGTVLAALPLVASAADKPKIVTTFTVIADMAQNIAGDHADVVSITKPGAEIHGYAPTPRDILRARDGDIILSNGLNLERWFEKFLRNIGDVPNVVVSDGIDPIDISSGEYEGRPNPHAWMSPDSATIYVENIRDALISIDPDNAGDYTANAAAYGEQIAAELAPMREMLADIPEERRWLVTSEGAFSYLARDLDLKELYLWPVNADQQGTPQQIRHVIDTMRANDIDVIFSESTVSDKPARQIARETGATYGGVLYVDSLSEPDGPVPTYLDLLAVTTGTVAEGLSNATPQ